MDQCDENFEIQWKALKAKQSEVPQITKALPIIKWTKAFKDFLSRVVGVRTIPFSYVIRDIVVVPVVAPALATDQPNSTEHGSVEAELIGRSSHGHALYRGDNSSVYHYPEEATRSTVYAPSIKPGLLWCSNMPERTSGKLRSRDKNSFFIQEFGKALIKSTQVWMVPAWTPHLLWD